MSLTGGGTHTLSCKHEEQQTNAKKRKRDDGVEDVKLDERRFTIHPDALDPFSAPQTLTPVCLLSRARLLLSYLDTTSSRRFSAHLQILELLKDRDGAAQVLVAKDDRAGRLYAVERVASRSYVLCRLHAWVTELELLRARRFPSPTEGLRLKRRRWSGASGSGKWWCKAAVDVTCPSSAPKCTQIPELTMCNPDLATVCVSANLASKLPEVSNVRCSHTDITPSEPPRQDHSPDDTLQELARHYLEALYASRMSLAYFVKGPLSRARTTFTSSQSATGWQTSDLIVCLRNWILSATIMEKKHRDGIRSVLKELSPDGLETPEHADKPKKRRKWKAKRDKQGFFINEMEYIEKWWRVDHDTESLMPGSAESTEDRMMRRSPRLRCRETYLQIILALEVLSLEQSLARHAKRPDTGELTGVMPSVEETQGVEQSAQQEPKKARARKLQDLTESLETLLDRLCIWRSLETRSPAKKAGRDDDEADDAGDELKSFCVEVVVPFYAARVPGHAVIINKKLGGPTAPTPAKHKTRSTHRPGEPTYRKGPEKQAKKPATRVSMDVSEQSVRQPASLIRSATDSDILQYQIKRESSEVQVALETIRPAKPPQRRARNSLVHTISFSRREVDLSAMSQANENKMRKKADVEQKLRDAITTLKKPNRTLAVQDIAESADQQFAKVTASRRQVPKARVSEQSKSYVAATPKHARTVNATPSRRHNIERTHHDTAASAGAVPTSCVRSLALQDTNGRPSGSNFAVPQTGHRTRATAASVNVEETPSRGDAKFLLPSLAHPGICDSPIARRHGLADADHAHARRLQIFNEAQPVGLPLVESSPYSTRTKWDKPVVETLAEQDKPVSLYKTLGWEEDYEELT
ncbi:hypothetical protein BAUCODRAFT_61834 [Baudoinia panamericana UAMH 10762]|uniref:DNA replication regulator Sld3 C-terminal domain-containing protein n=1 Tax=Baudoinia panamericana (strain UAMH 10762) TaxID=717646 RepID=M2NN45_BAUPA|nr:uncharacterized protein BAUCODRAFT_61834 [Baudoinia panamericana UAMH 10762]EMD00935.1 hypothetical protein BAUCODRAFT_61834 [Baudoinia panamericana UAMH 10762]